MCEFRHKQKVEHMHKLRQYAHTHTNSTHTTVAERITQQISDPVNYMWPLPEVKGHSQ